MQEQGIEALDGREVLGGKDRGRGQGRGGGCGMSHMRRFEHEARDRKCRHNLLTSLSQMPCLPLACARDSL